jgi:ribosomal protein S12 methylthiotransferase accessory factor
MTREPDYERLIDLRSGIIRVAEPSQPLLPGTPAAYQLYFADVANTRWLGGGWQADRVATGAAFWNGEVARKAAIGEALERYCGNFVPAHLLRRASYNQLRRRGENALDPAELMLYSPQQYAERGFPFVLFSRDLEVLWVRGEQIPEGTSAWLPASLVYLNYYGTTGIGKKEPPTNHILYSGIACGEELIERDATMIWWLSGSPMPGIGLDNALLKSALVTPPGDQTELNYYLMYIKTPFEIPVVLALVEDPAQKVLISGVACRADPTRAALKALAEAIHMRRYCYGFLDSEGDIWKAIRLGVLDERGFKPYRADRAYLDDFRPDFHDVIDLGTQAQYYLDPRTHGYLDRIKKPAEYVGLEDLPRVTNTDLRQTYLKKLTAKGFRAYSIDITTPDVKQTGLCVVRVIVPGLYPNGPAAFPFLGGRRLYEEPAALGWLPDVLTEAELVRRPLPFS